MDGCIPLLTLILLALQFMHEATESVSIPNAQMLFMQQELNWWLLQMQMAHQHQSQMQVQMMNAPPPQHQDQRPLIVATTRSYNYRIKSQKENPSQAVLTFDEMRQRGCLPNIYTLNFLLDAFSNDKEDKFKVWHYYYLMTRDYKIRPNIVTANTMLKVFERKKYLHEAERVWTEVIVPFQFNCK